MNRQLSDVSEGVLVCRTMVHAEQLGSGILH